MQIKVFFEKAGFTVISKAPVPLPLLPMKDRHLASIGFRWQGRLYYLGLQGSRRRVYAPCC